MKSKQIRFFRIFLQLQIPDEVTPPEVSMDVGWVTYTTQEKPPTARPQPHALVRPIPGHHVDSTRETSWSSPSPTRPSTGSISWPEQFLSGIGSRNPQHRLTQPRHSRDSWQGTPAHKLHISHQPILGISLMRDWGLLSRSSRHPNPSCNSHLQHYKSYILLQNHPPVERPPLCYSISTKPWDF